MNKNRSKIGQRLIDIALEWEEKYSIAPNITTAISEYDAARCVGMSDREYAAAMIGRTAASEGYDFRYEGNRYQVKGRRPGKPGRRVVRVPKAHNYYWDYLVFVLYDWEYDVLGIWQWTRRNYKKKIEPLERVTVTNMREGKRLK